jgi:hypothetical protein
MLVLRRPFLSERPSVLFFRLGALLQLETPLAHDREALQVRILERALGDLSYASHVTSFQTIYGSHKTLDRIGPLLMSCRVSVGGNACLPISCEPRYIDYGH